jgi:hypothetical protein
MGERGGIPAGGGVAYTTTRRRSVDPRRPADPRRAVETVLRVAEAEGREGFSLAEIRRAYGLESDEVRALARDLGLRFDRGLVRR